MSLFRNVVPVCKALDGKHQESLNTRRAVGLGGDIRRVAPVDSAVWYSL